MRCFVCLLAGGILIGGCSFLHPKPAPAPASDWAIPPAQTPPPPAATPVVKSPPAKLIVTPEPMLVGKVTMVKDAARFAVLNFPVGSLPGIGQRLSVYRNGLKVGEVKITGPQLGENIVADILSGEAQNGDEIRGH